MYGIIAFFRKNYFVLLFAALEFLSLSFVFKDNYYHEAGYFNTSNSIAGSIYTTESNISSYFSLKTQNNQLVEENAQLHNLIAGTGDTTKHPKVLQKNPYGQQFNFMTAEVIDNTTNLLNNHITLNVGKTQGVVSGMGVMAPSGIVGIVVNVSDHYSVVMSLLHKNFQLSAMLKKGGAFGTISWKGGDYQMALLSQIPMSEKVKVGDTVVTSGYSNIFPKDVMVGVVEEFKPIPDQYFFSIKVRLATNFKKLRYVYVVSDLGKQEKTDLEDKTTKEEGH
ncbi:MAG TPA: rod shape-determining protein MreC [Bacteroidia bacterium]|jgi:rod shape-determining protein MreC|nr:rod shape-determining protein MreC [Bacteroidia bacterium]